MLISQAINFHSDFGKTAKIPTYRNVIGGKDSYREDTVPLISDALRTPITSVRSLAEILHDNPDIDGYLREKFLNIIIKETERLSNLVDRILDVPDMVGIA